MGVLCGLAASRGQGGWVKECISIWNMREGPVDVQVCAEGPYLSFQRQTRSFYMCTTPSQTHSRCPSAIHHVLVDVSVCVHERGREACGRGLRGLEEEDTPIM